jgi:hypothetical protein
MTPKVMYLAKTSFIIKMSQAPVAQSYNPSYSGGRNQEDHVQGQPEQNESQTLSQK